MSVARFIPRRLFASQLFESQPLACDVLGSFKKTIRVIALAIVETERLFVKVTEQVVRLNRDVSAFECALQQAPKVFNPVDVNVSFDVLLSMVYHVMDKLIRQIVVRLETVTV